MRYRNEPVLRIKKEKKLGQEVCTFTSRRSFITIFQSSSFAAATSRTSAVVLAALANESNDRQLADVDAAGVVVVLMDCV